MAKLNIFGKSPVGAYLRLNEWIWNQFHRSLAAIPPWRIYGSFLHTLVCLGANRRQFLGTFFLRNRPELELIRRLSDQKGKGSTLKIIVLGCSNGSEVYSILWTIRSARPDLKIMMNAVDISNEVLELARKGTYSLGPPELVDQQIFERMTENEMREMFDKEDGRLKIKSWLKEGIIWRLGDAGDPEMLNIFGPQDIVVANNFLCHMDPPDAERCLRNIARLVKPGGYLFVSGIDLDVRTKCARDLRWRPVLDLMKDIHDGDPVLRADWPFKWWGLEPFNNKRHDWRLRYASVFQVNEKT
jgi:SAM-dependent methyltransferase